MPIRRFRRRIPVQVSDCSPPPSNSCKSKSVTVRRFRRRIPVQVSAYSPLLSSNSCKTVPICRFCHRIPVQVSAYSPFPSSNFLPKVRAYLPPPTSNSCKFQPTLPREIFVARGSQNGSTASSINIDPHRPSRQTSQFLKPTWPSISNIS